MATKATNEHPIWHRLADVVLADLLSLHSIKQRAYGASWRKHGEFLSIFANITRKADRLFAGGTETPDETLLDTIADLAVYCMLYRSWLHDTADEFDEGMTRSAGAVAAYAQFVHPNGAELPRKAQWQAERLEALILRQIADGATPARQHIKRTVVTGLATYAVLWLAWLAYTQPAAYQAWASQWHTADVAVNATLDERYASRVQELNDATAKAE